MTIYPLAHSDEPQREAGPLDALSLVLSPFLPCLWIWTLAQDIWLHLHFCFLQIQCPSDSPKRDRAAPSAFSWPQLLLPPPSLASREIPHRFLSWPHPPKKLSHDNWVSRGLHEKWQLWVWHSKSECCNYSKYTVSVFTDSCFQNITMVNTS